MLLTNVVKVPFSGKLVKLMSWVFTLLFATPTNSNIIAMYLYAAMFSCEIHDYFSHAN